MKVLNFIEKSLEFILLLFVWILCLPVAIYIELRDRDGTLKRFFKELTD